MQTPASPPPLAATTDVRGMFDRIAGRYDAANRVMSAGIDKRWRKSALEPLLATAGDRPCLLDLGAGTLVSSLELAQAAPHARIAAADFSHEMLRVGAKKLVTKPANIGAHGADAHSLPYRAQAFDGIFTAFCVRNIVRRPEAFRELRRVLRPGATLVILEFFRPAKQRWFFDSVYNKHVLPLIGWAVSGDRDAYRYLPDSISAFAQREEVQQELGAAGFTDVSGRELFPSGVASLVVAR